MKMQLRKRNQHDVVPVTATPIQAKSLADIRPMDTAPPAVQARQTADVNQQAQEQRGLNLAEIPIFAPETGRSAPRVQMKLDAAVQRKLTVGAPGDKYEQEADRVAEKVVQQINTPATEKATSSQGLQKHTQSNHPVQANSISNLQKAPINIIQRDIVEAEVKSAVIGGHTLYSKGGVEIGSISSKSKILIDWFYAEDVPKVKRGTFERDKALYKVIDFNRKDLKLKNEADINYEDIYINVNGVTIPEEDAEIDVGDGDYKLEKLKYIGEIINKYKGIHENFQKYRKHLGTKTWNLISYVWDKLNTVLSYIGYIDPTGITKAIEKVSKMIKSAVDIIAEVYILSNTELKEQLTPLLSKSSLMGLLAEAGKFLAEKVKDELVKIDGLQMTVNLPWADEKKFDLKQTYANYGEDRDEEIG